MFATDRAKGRRLARTALLPLACALAAACASSSSQSDDEIESFVTLEVTSPLPGAELFAPEAPVIAVSGTVATDHPEGIPEVWVNGAMAPVGPDGSFAAEIPPEFGVNHIKVEGRDGFSEPAEQRMDVLWAPDYLPPLTGSTGFDLEEALELRLGQRLFDTRLFGSDLDLGTDPVVARGFAQAVELVLWHMDLAALLEGGIHFGGESSSLDAVVPASEILDDVVVDVEIIDAPVTGVDLHIDLLGVYVGMEGEFVLNDEVCVVAGGLAADMHASARVTLEKAPEGQVEVAVTDIQASVGPLVPMFEGPDGDKLNGFINTSESDFRVLVEDLITQELVPTFTDGLPALFGTLLSALDNVFSDVSFELDAGLGQPVALTIDGGVGGLEVVAGPPIGDAPGHLTVGQDLSIRTAQAPVHSSSRGAPRPHAMPSAPFPNVAGLHLAARQDMLSGLLHALWNAGLLDGTTMVGNLRAVVRANLPPVVRAAPLASSCQLDGERCELLLQIGQLEVELEDFAQSFALSATAGARIELEDGELFLVLQETPVIEVWETSEIPGGVLTPEAMRDLINDLVWPELYTAITENLRIALPLPDLADLGLDQVAPDLASAAIELVKRQRLSVDSGYLGLSADVELEAPKP